MKRHSLTIFGRLVGVASLTASLLWPAPAEAADSKNETIAKAAAAILVDAAKNPERYRSAWSKFVGWVDDHHPTYKWRTEEGRTFVILPFGGGDTRLTDNFAHEPFAKGTRQVEFHLLNVKDAHIKKVYWEVKSDVPGLGDGHRQCDDNHKTRHGDTICLDQRAGKDYAYHLAGRWEDGVSKDQFFRENPNGAVLLILK